MNFLQVDEINAINIETEQNRQRFKKMSQNLCCSEKPYGKIRESIKIALISAIITLSPIRAEAKSSGLPGAEGFTPPTHSRPANQNSGLFNQPKSQNQNPGSDNPGGNGDNGDNNSNPESKCIENPKVNNMYDYLLQGPIHQSDTETESDWSEDSDWDEEDFLERLEVTASDGRIVGLRRDQLRDKAHHLDAFPNIKIPKTFDLAYVKGLDYRLRLRYVRDRSKLPERIISDMQMEASKFFRSTRTKAFSGSLGRNKIKGTIYINELTKTVAFVNDSNSDCRTILPMSRPQIQRLRDQGYRLFPNA